MFAHQPARVVEGYWSQPTKSAELLVAVARTKSLDYAFQVRTRLDDKEADIHTAPGQTCLSRVRPSSSKQRAETVVIAGRPFEKVVAEAVKSTGDAKLGSLIFLKQGCIACHTTAKSDTPKGPYLGDIATRYKRLELLESILKPGAKIAQGFETQYFELTNGKVVEGFVVREAGDEVEIRNVQGVATVLKKAEIDVRGKREISVMPERLGEDLHHS